jgi:hypothetical protein
VKSAKDPVLLKNQIGKEKKQKTHREKGGSEREMRQGKHTKGRESGANGKLLSF